MAYAKTLTTIVPVDSGDDLELLRWLTRESFERKAESDLLRITEYTETPVDPADIPPKVGTQLGRPVEEFSWFEFTAIAVRADA